jgi:hypothetical protein
LAARLAFSQISSMLGAGFSGILKRRRFNHFRPHRGIDGLVPADRFFGSEDAARKTMRAELAGARRDHGVTKKWIGPIEVLPLGSVTT